MCSGARDDDVKDYTRVLRFSRSAFYLRWRDVRNNERNEVDYVYLDCTRVIEQHLVVTRVKYRLDVSYRCGV